MKKGWLILAFTFVLISIVIGNLKVNLTVYLIFVAVCATIAVLLTILKFSKTSKPTPTHFETNKDIPIKSQPWQKRVQGNIVGIDLGTTKSAIGIWKNGKPEIIPNKIGHRIIPSLVLLTHDDQIFVGEEAQNHPERYHGKNITISSVKRFLGTRNIPERESSYPQEIAALILGELKYQAEKNLNKAIHKAVIAIPAHFDANQRRATREAAEIVGLEVINLINEATAAVVAYGFRKSIYNASEKTEEVLVFDFGGGTLDISVVIYGNRLFEVLSVAGDSRLGGDDFDEAIYKYLLNQASNQYNIGIKLTSFQEMVLKEYVKQAKVELSSMSDTEIYIPGFLNINNRATDFRISLNRKTFETLTKPLLNRSIELVKEALLRAKIHYTDLDALLLLGGTSHIPIIRETIRKELHCEPITGVDPILGVTHGATILAALYEGIIEEVLLLNVVSGPIGVEIDNGKFLTIIPPNTTIPTRKSISLTTQADCQTEIMVKVYQGYSSITENNTCLGIFKLNILPQPAGKPEIEITIDVDACGLINLSAKEIKSGKEIGAKLDSLHSMDYDELIKAKQIVKLWLDDRKSDE